MKPPLFQLVHIAPCFLHVAPCDDSPSSLELENWDEVPPLKPWLLQGSDVAVGLFQRDFAYLGFAAVIIFLKHTLETLNPDWYTGKIIVRGKSINAEHTRSKDIFRFPDRFYPLNPKSLMKTLNKI